MKYTSLITAAAVLSASTFALDAKFGLGVEAGNFTYFGERKIGAQITDTTISSVTANTGIAATDVNGSFTDLGQDKNIISLKASAAMKMSERFSLEAGLVVSSGKLEVNQKRSGIYGGPLATDKVLSVAEIVNMKIKPQYGLSLKALFGFNETFKVGPEVRITRFEKVYDGSIQHYIMDAVGGVAPAISDDSSLEYDANGSGNSNLIKNDKVNTTETSFGISMTGMLNEKLAVSAGYLTLKAKKNTVTLTSAIATGIDTNAARDVIGMATAETTKYDVESSKPTLDQYYVGLSMSF